ncbi:hypothetical protein CEXT_290551 [Caerostris extrusa]|uniref:Uncharacterized protein n=1 Tax=Caerostris extrusa TaxID=172846 RepID=A0AAV4UTS6_CAEEX|nr:hypothetical protein CEXT_290551 [Caerostris extrusa]
MCSILWFTPWYLDPLIVRQRILMEDPVVSLCYVTSYDVNPMHVSYQHSLMCVHPMICQNVLIVAGASCDITKCSISMEHLVVCQKCSCVM